MKQILATILLSLSLAGCSLSTTDKAVLAANEIHEIAGAENKLIDSYCTPKYQAAKTKADVQEADRTCLPARSSYYAVRAAWTALSAILEAAKYNQATDQQIQTAAIKLASALADLEKAIEVIR